MPPEKVTCARASWPHQEVNAGARTQVTFHKPHDLTRKQYKLLASVCKPTKLGRIYAKQGSTELAATYTDERQRQSEVCTWRF